MQRWNVNAPHFDSETFDSGKPDVGDHRRLLTDRRIGLTLEVSGDLGGILKSFPPAEGKPQPQIVWTIAA